MNNRKEPETKSLTEYVEKLLKELERLKYTSCRDCERFGDYHYCKDCYGYDLFKSEDEEEYE